MLRFLGGAASALLLVLAGFFIWKGWAQDEEIVPAAPEAAPALVTPLRQQPIEAPPAAPERTKEERRFDRADRNDDGRITQDELLHPRRAVFNRLDRNGDGRLSFEEWAVRTIEKFAGADADRNGALTRAEYATTAPRPRNTRRRQNCAC